MLRVLWIMFWCVAIITGVTLLGGFFTTDSVTSKCSDSLISCLSNTSGLSVWGKMKSGMGCVYENAICVFDHIKALF